ncbi:MAG: ThiF family adenylyltransferase [Bacteroidota bacterium]|nr:ThiF family adenylyltransferase [Bacteroidota bacterium]
MAIVFIPTPLRKFTGNHSSVGVTGSTIQEILQNLGRLYPELSTYLYDENGIKGFVKIYLGDEDIAYLEGEKTIIKEDDTISIIPAIAGGSGILNKDELVRYSRHILIPEFNVAGQEKLKQASVLVVGTGGLGAPVLQYLSAAGIGTIGILDFDVVEESNLHRQVLFTSHDIGKLKVDVARNRLQSQNPYVNYITHPVVLNSENALGILKDYDIIVDGTDNFPSRYLVNDACVLLNKVNVYASIFQFEGQVSVFNEVQKDGTRGPNFRDLFPVPPPPGLVPSCAEGGVLGVLPGIMGSLQANEVIKVITGIGETLSGRIFIFDAAAFLTRILNVKKDPKNPINGEHPSITGLIDYFQFCGVPNQHEIKSITVNQLVQWTESLQDFQLIDVREVNEYQLSNIKGLLLPKSEIEKHIDKIDRNKKVVIHCRSGKRSAEVIDLLQSTYGFDNLYNLQGGILEWAKEIEPEFVVV